MILYFSFIDSLSHTSDLMDFDHDISEIRGPVAAIELLDQNGCGRFGCGAGGGIRTPEGLRHRLLKLRQRPDASTP